MTAPAAQLRPHRARWRLAALFTIALTVAAPASAQISLATAVNLALKTNPRVKLAEADVARARAALAESRDAFIPAVAATGGVGKSTGAPLNPPVIFSIAAQSLVFNSSQRDFIRAARAGVQSAQLTLDAARTDTVEDVTNTYLALDNALQRQRVQNDALREAEQLVRITGDRFTAGVDPHVEVTKSRQTAAQIHLQQLLVEDDIAAALEHLARLTGLSARGLVTDHRSVPALPPPQPPAPAEVSASEAPGPGLSAAFAAAQAKQFTAHGEKHYLLRPQVAFNASYSRISTAFTTYTEYYPGFNADNNSFNSLNLGVEFTVPILDMVHRAKAHEAAADAAHSLFEAQLQQMQFLESRNKLRHSTAELAARRDLAQLNQELAQDQLDAVLLRLQADAGAVSGEQLTPKDEENARLQERLRALDTLSMELQLQQAEVSLMRQEGTLASWLGAALPSGAASGAPGPHVAGPDLPAVPSPQPPTPATVGTEAPGTSAPAETPGTPPTAPSTAVPVVPTTGTTPTTLPAGPVTVPGPVTTPPSTPPATTQPPH